MDILGVFQLLNIITLLDIVFPKGVGELIVLVCWCGFFLLACVMAVEIALTKELTYNNTRARITMEEIGVIVFPGGSTKEMILPRNIATLKYKMGDKDAQWTIDNDQWQMKSSGVRYTFFHPDLPHNVSLNTLVKMLLTTKTMKINDDDQIEYIPIENLTFTAFDQDGKIMTIATAMAKDIADPKAKLLAYAGAAAVVMAVCIGGALLFIVAPHGTCQAATETASQAIQNVTSSPSTTIPALSGMH